MFKPNLRLVDLRWVLVARLSLIVVSLALIVSVVFNVHVLESTQFLVDHQANRIAKLVKLNDEIFTKVIFNKRTVNKELRCLASNIYFEAASESTVGKLAVALVTINRVKHPEFPNTICDVVFEGHKRKDKLCQFSWTCDKLINKNVPKKTNLWDDSEKLAKIVLFQQDTIVDITNGAIYYHADYVTPKWSKTMKKVATIDRHLFYIPLNK